jgi:type I restriction enzyme S subunit
MSGYSENWEKVKLEDLCLIERGGSPRPISNFLTKDLNGINWIKIGDAIINSKYINNTNEKIISEGSKYSRKVNKGDFILSNSMSFGRPYILNIDGCIHDGWLVLSDFSDKINKDFLYYVLSSSIVKKHFESEARGAIVKNLNIDIVKNVIIPLPELTVQERIAKIIEAKLATVENVKKASDEQYANCALLKKRFYENLFKKYTNKYELGNYCSIVNGSTPKTGIDEYWNGNIVWITPTDLGKNENKYISNSERKITKIVYNSANTTIIEKNNIILSTRAPIGHIAINNVEACTNQGCKSILPSNELNVDFLYYYLKYNKGKLDELGSGTTFKELSTNSLMSFKIPVPTIDEQKRIVSIFEMKLIIIEKIINNINEQSSYINALPQSILRKAFNGEY